MIAFICLFFPAVMGVWLFEHATKTKLEKRQLLYRYCFNVIVINFICFAIKTVSELLQTKALSTLTKTEKSAANILLKKENYSEFRSAARGSPLFLKTLTTPAEAFSRL